ATHHARSARRSASIIAERRNPPAASRPPIALPMPSSRGLLREALDGVRLPIRGMEGPSAGTRWENLGVGSPQTLSEGDRRIVAVWAADCAERVLGLFEAEAPGDSRPRDA